LLREVQRRGGVGLHHFHQLGGIFAGALAGAREHRLDGAVVALGDILELGVTIASLRNALLGECAHLLGNFERNDRGGERIGGICHGMHPSKWVNDVTPCAPGDQNAGNADLDHSVGMPYIGRLTLNDYIMSILCNAMERNLRCNAVWRTRTGCAFPRRCEASSGSTSGRSLPRFRAEDPLPDPPFRGKGSRLSLLAWRHPWPP